MDTHGGPREEEYQSRGRSHALWVLLHPAPQLHLCSTRAGGIVGGVEQILPGLASVWLLWCSRELLAFPLPAPHPSPSVGLLCGWSLPQAIRPLSKLS